MKAWLLDKLGDGIEKLHLADVPDPVPAAGEVVVRIVLAGLNPADYYLAQNEYPAKPALPHILGRDAIGVVESVGTGVHGIAPGDKRVVVRSEVGVNRAGTFAQRVAVPVESLVEPVPGWTDEESAGAALVYLTAYQALTQWGGLPPTAAVLITGATGGVGVASVQLAKAMGYKVVGLSRNATKSEKLLQIGADAVLDPQSSDWPMQMTDRLGGRKIDLAIDNVGGPLFNRLLDPLGRNGRISCVGRLAGAVPEFNTAALFFRRCKIGGVSVGSYSAQESRDAWEKIVRLMAASNAHPLVDSVHPFSKLPQAFARLKAGPMGKVLLQTAEA
jgi:NADPH2:quinone reductase